MGLSPRRIGDRPWSCLSIRKTTGIRWHRQIDSSTRRLDFYVSSITVNVLSSHTISLRSVCVSITNSQGFKLINSTTIHCEIVMFQFHLAKTWWIGRENKLSAYSVRHGHQFQKVMLHSHWTSNVLIYVHHLVLTSLGSVKLDILVYIYSNHVHLSVPCQLTEERFTAQRMLSSVKLVALRQRKWSCN